MPEKATQGKRRKAPTTRARELGIPFNGTPGRYNAITDVAGISVGHATIHSGKGPNAIRSGVTGILVRPRGSRQPVAAASAQLNGNGEMTGLPFLETVGKLWGGIALTETLSVGAVRDALARYLHGRLRLGSEPSALPVAAETWPGMLSDAWASPVTGAHVDQALDAAKPGPVEEGGVGGGTGSVCFQYKGGIGTASRVVGKHTVGVLVQTNFGKRGDLQIAGVPVGKKLTGLKPLYPKPGRKKDGSIIVVVATDAPLLPHQLKMVATRAGLGIGQCGGIGRATSGDLFLAFSTAPIKRSGGVDHWVGLPDLRLDPIYEAVVQATEEAILNALVAAKTMTGRDGNTVYAMPHDEVQRLLKTAGRLVPVEDAAGPAKGPATRRKATAVRGAAAP